LLSNIYFRVKRDQKVEIIFVKKIFLIIWGNYLKNIIL